MMQIWSNGVIDVPTACREQEIRKTFGCGVMPEFPLVELCCFEQTLEIPRLQKENWHKSDNSKIVFSQSDFVCRSVVTNLAV